MEPGTGNRAHIGVVCMTLRDGTYSCVKSCTGASGRSLVSGIGFWWYMGNGDTTDVRLTRTAYFFGGG